MKELLSDESLLEVDRRVHETQARGLLEQGGTGAVGSSLVALFVAGALYGEVSHAALAAWLGVLIAIQLGRLLLAFAVGQKAEGEDRVSRWARVNIYLIWASALIWGTGVLVLWPESTLQQIVLPMAITGLSAAGAIGYSSIREASIPFGAMTLLPLSLRFIVEGTSVHILIGALALVYLVFIFRIASTMRRSSTAALVARFESQLHAGKAAEASAELAKKTELLEELVRLDGLTQIPNRRQFTEVFEREWRRAARIGGPVSILMADIDHFKRYNDSYGHLAGDDCLKAVARTLDKSLKRATELVARYGGEEFVVVLGETDLEDARETAERLRKNVMNIAIPHADSDTASHVTISIGVATTIPDKDGDPTSLIEAADGALYEAKDGGRNRVRIRRV